jgi:hypothetical protein
MVTNYQSIHDRLGVELIRVRMIGSTIVFYEDLNVT